MAYYSQINLKNLTAFLLPSRKVTPCLYSPQCQCIFMVQEKIQEHSMYLCQNLQYRRIQNPYGELFLILIFLLLFPQHNFFPLYSLGTQLYIHVYILFSYIIMLHHKNPDIVLSATQQDLIINPFQMQQSPSSNPKHPIHPNPSPSTQATTSLFSKSRIFISVEKFICAVYQIPDMSDIMWYLSFSF